MTTATTTEVYRDGNYYIVRTSEARYAIRLDDSDYNYPFALGQPRPLSDKLARVPGLSHSTHFCVGGIPVRLGARDYFEAAWAEEAARRESKAKADADALEAAVPGARKALDLYWLTVEETDHNAKAMDDLMSEHNDGAYDPGFRSGSRAALDAWLSDHPRAAIYLTAFLQHHYAHWADNTGKGAAGAKAMELLKSGSSIEDAQVALDARREAAR